MKNIKIFALIAASAAIFACTTMDEIVPESGTLLTSQLQETNSAIPSRANASFLGMLTSIGQPAKLANRADDFGLLMLLFSSDVEGADIVIADSGYNHFSVCGEYSSRNANYWNPYLRYSYIYNEIAAANDFIVSIAEDAPQETRYLVAQAHAIRAYAYMLAAPAFQFSYASSKDKPCVPIVLPDTPDFTHNPRASVEEIYKQIMSDLDYAVENLEGYKRSSKMNIDKQVALGLRARANLAMENWEEAAADAEAALEGYEPASIEDVSKPYFYSISEPNWIWGYDMTTEVAKKYPYATMDSWLRSFSGDGYAPACQVTSRINTLLYDKIPASDVRKGWWVDENLESPLIEGLLWDNGEPVATAEVDDVKMEYLPYTNVKFGVDKIATIANDNDFPLMRAEEMILIKAEALAKAGNEAGGKQALEDFVKTYRDPSYSADAAGRSFSDEVWFQRRLELWGEGFFLADRNRLEKPLVRFHGGQAGNFPDKFRFNMAANDGYLLMRFPQSEMNTNFDIVDNTEGSAPVKDQNPSLKDGVTD